MNAKYVIIMQINKLFLCKIPAGVINQGINAGDMKLRLSHSPGQDANAPAKAGHLPGRYVWEPVYLRFSTPLRLFLL